MDQAFESGDRSLVVVPSPSPAPPRWDLDYEALARDLSPLGNATRLRLLNYLTRPHYLEEIASFLKVNRSAAKKHLDQLVEAGLVARHAGMRDSGPVVEYRIVPERLFEVFDHTRSLGTLRPSGAAADLSRTKVGAPATAVVLETDARPRLHVAYGVEIGSVIVLPELKAPATLGRDARSCDVVVGADPFVSSRHAQIAGTKDGFLLTDLYSTNGTLVDGVRIAPGTPVPLRNGHIVTLGRTLLVFRNR